MQARSRSEPAFGPLTLKVWCEVGNDTSAPPSAQDTVLDFYGVGIKAAEIRGLVDRMATLARLVEELRDPVNQFELPQAR